MGYVIAFILGEIAGVFILALFVGSEEKRSLHREGKEHYGEKEK